MQVLTVLGSPRRHGNTAKALGWVEDQFRADRHEVDQINILDYNVGGCRECLACKKGGKSLCAVGDDAIGLFERMARADLVLIAGARLGQALRLARWARAADRQAGCRWVRQPFRHRTLA